jgi:hypothetical protein
MIVCDLCIIVISFTFPIRLDLSVCLLLPGSRTSFLFVTYQIELSNLSVMGLTIKPMEVLFQLVCFNCALKRVGCTVLYNCTSKDPYP